VICGCGDGGRPWHERKPRATIRLDRDDDFGNCIRSRPLRARTVCESR
jgi:hypothetical protein